jgi:hypothetical protein
VLFALLVEQLRRSAVKPAARHGLGAREDAVGPRSLGGGRREVGTDADRRVEEDGPLDAFRIARGELEDEAAAEAVADPGGLLDAGCLDCLEHIGEVRLDSTAAPTPTGRDRAGRERSPGSPAAGRPAGRSARRAP